MTRRHKAYILLTLEDYKRRMVPGLEQFSEEEISEMIAAVEAIEPESSPKQEFADKVVCTDTPLPPDAEEMRGRVREKEGHR